MARKRARRRRSKMAGKCKVVSIKGQGRRKLCWGRNGRIKSNRKAS